MQHAKVDLNLFQVLKTVYEEGTITGAANRLFLTQPAVSHSLARLREKFSDQLFIRHGRKMQPTELCIKIMPQVVSALNTLEATFESETEFDIQHHQREIKIGFRDLLEALLFPALLKRVVGEAPGISISSHQVAMGDIDAELANSSLDIVVDALFPVGKNIINLPVGCDPFVLVCRKGHSIEADNSLEHYLSCRHVIATLKNSNVNFVDLALTQHQKVRNVALRCENYFAALKVVSVTDLLTTMPSTFARQMTQILPLTVMPLPFEVSPISAHMYWHENLNDDPVIHWMRKTLIEVAQVVLPQR